MIYDQQEKFKELISFISTHTIDRSINRADQKAREENIKWNASLFFAKAIHLAKPREQQLTLEEFNQFKKDYEGRNSKIDTDTIFQKYWLRNVLGKIRIAGTVSSACHTFSGISSFRNELKFLFEKFPEGIKGKEKLPKAEFDQIKSKYESEHNLILNDEGLNKPSWLSKSDDGITISNINIYFKPYLDHWEEFEFLSAYKEQISNNEDKGLKIVKSDLEQLYQSFKQFYIQTPSIDNLIDQKLLEEKEEFYYLNFYHVEISCWSTLSDQTIAFYWQLLIEAARVKSHLEKLISHYTHERKVFLTLVYFQGKQSDFQKNWEAYHTDILTTIQYPNGFELDTNQVVDVTKDFQREKSGIKIGKAHHKDGVVIYHIFVNINHKVNA